MADENQQPLRVGPVSQNQPDFRSNQPQQQNPQRAQQPVQRGIPGAKQPPVPSPEKVQEIMRQQQQEQQRQIAEAQARARAAAGNAQQAPAQPQQQSRISQNAQQPAQPQQSAPMSSSHPPPPGVPAEMWNQMPQQMQEAYLSMPNMQQPQQPQQQAPQQQAPSPVPGMSAQEVLAGPPRQQPQQGNQFAQYAEPQQVQRDVIHWHPARSKGVDVQLTDTVVKSVPSGGVPAESDPQARVVLALFGEILAIRDDMRQLQVPQAAQMPPDLDARIRRLEGALFEQANAMNQRARSVREQIQMFQHKGMTPEQIINELNGISAKAEEQVSQTGRVAEDEQQAPPPEPESSE